MDRFVTRIAGVEYSFREALEFRCDFCSRITLTGLCGCTGPSPTSFRKILYGVPTDKHGEIQEE